MQRTSRAAEVGWLIDVQKASFIWSSPQRLQREEGRPNHAKSVAFCPAVLDHEARLYEITCPIDARIRFQYDEKTKNPVLANAAGDRSPIRSRHLGELVTLVARKEWRHPDRPILQITTPYLFVADEPVYLTQLPPFASYQSPAWPGVVIGGRMPIHIWPRSLMWAFEWYDTQSELVLQRGQPWFYVRFETHDPSRPIHLVEAEMTAALQKHVAGLSGVTNYVNRTFSLFQIAKERRPAILLVPKKRP